MRYVLLSVLVFLGVSVYFYKQEEKRDSIGFTQSDNHSQAVLDRTTIERPDYSKSVISSDPIDTLNPADPDEIFPGQGGFFYRSINDISHDPALLQQLKEDLDNFKKHGSIGKGRTTIEFENTQELKEALSRKGINSIVDGLAFNPVHLVNVAGSGFVMIGADDQGKMISGRGWNGFFQSFEERATGRQIELSESQIETQLGDETEIIEEFINDKVGDVRASVQVMKDGEGNDVYSIQWNDGDRSFTLNTKSFSRGEAMALSAVVLDRYRMLPYRGWKTPYALDPNNPLHRIAIQRDQQRLNLKPQR